MPPQKTLPELLEDLRAEPSEGVLRNVLSDLKELEIVSLREVAARVERRLNAPVGDDASRRVLIGSAIADVQQEIRSVLGEGAPLRRGLRVDIPPRQIDFDNVEGGRRRSQTKRFGSCVKAVRKTVKARKGSTAEGAAIAICTKSMLFPRGRTLKRYRKGRLLTQKRRR